MTDAVVAEGLTKHYKNVKPLDGLDLRVPQGSVLGVLGPNGAGKTTAVRILTTLLKPDAGHAEVAGINVVGDPAGVRSKISTTPATGWPRHTPGACAVGSTSRAL